VALPARLPPTRPTRQRTESRLQSQARKAYAATRPLQRQLSGGDRRPVRSATVTPAEAQIIWTEYLRHRARVRGFDLAVIEHIVRFSSERYFDTDTRRMVAIGRHGRWLVLVPYDQDGQTITPVTIHATTRQQLTARVQRGRLVP